MSDPGRAFWEAITTLLFPPRCLFCQKTISAGKFLCARCLPRLGGTKEGCSQCGAPFETLTIANKKGESCRWCAGFSFSFTGVRAVAYYRGEWRDVMHRFKYAGKRYLARPIAGLMFKELDDWRGSQTDLITSVPLHPRRLKERGYNQSYLLARELSRLSGKPYRDLLQRRVDTPSQTGLNRKQRLRNLHSAFMPVDSSCEAQKAKGESKAGKARKAGRTESAKNAENAREAVEVGKTENAGKFRGASSVLLVDDVFTTGATAEAISRVLLSTGIEKVYVIVAAR